MSNKLTTTLFNAFPKQVLTVLAVENLQNVPVLKRVRSSLHELRDISEPKKVILGRWDTKTRPAEHFMNKGYYF